MSLLVLENGSMPVTVSSICHCTSGAKITSLPHTLFGTSKLKIMRKRASKDETGIFCGGPYPQINSPLIRQTCLAGAVRKQHSCVVHGLLCSLPQLGFSIRTEHLQAWLACPSLLRETRQRSIMPEQPPNEGL